MLTLRDGDHSQCCLNRTGLKTKVACILSSVLFHLIRGSLNEDYNEMYNYPNIGSLAFVLATTLYSMTLCLHPKSLCIRYRPVQSIFKVILVIIISNGLLVVGWQQLINLTVEGILCLHDLLLFLNLPCPFLVNHMVAYYVGHLEAFLILGWVSRILVAPASQDVPSLDELTTSSLDASVEDPYSISGSEGMSYDSYFYRNESDISSRESL